LNPQTGAVPFELNELMDVLDDNQLIEAVDGVKNGRSFAALRRTKDGSASR
jgi:hypothetical protein